MGGIIATTGHMTVAIVMIVTDAMAVMGITADTETRMARTGTEGTEHVEIHQAIPFYGHCCGAVHGRRGVDGSGPAGDYEAYRGRGRPCVHSGGTPDLRLVWTLGLQMGALVLLGGLCGSLNNVFVHLSSQNIGNSMRKECFGSIMGLSFPQIDRFGTGSLVTRVTNDITQVQQFVSLFVRGMLRTSALTFGSIYFMFRLNFRFGMIALCAFPFLAGVIAFCLWKADPLFARLQAQLDAVNAILQEDISGIRVIKACVRESYEKMRFGKANGELIGTQLRTLAIFAFMNPLANALMYVAIAVILLAGPTEVGKGAATPGAIMAAITYATQMLHGILMLVMLFQNISRGLASWKRVKEVLESVPEIVDGSMDEAAETQDGIDVRDYRQEALRDKIAVAMQKCELFGQTVGENIAWGLPGADGTAVRAAACVAQADGFISSMPEGYGTAVAERGMSLSGGQRQRVSAARAFIKPAEIFIFDDATSALDLKTEAELYRAFKASHPDSTKIIIAQRIASVCMADRIIVLEDGRIIACGTHKELMGSCRVYQDIYHSQIGEEAESA